MFKLIQSKEAKSLMFKLIQLFLILNASYVTLLHAHGANEEVCTSYNGTRSNCTACVESDCGYVIDHGDCAKDCVNVTDAPCFSLKNTPGYTVAEVCVKAKEALDSPPAQSAAIDITFLSSLFMSIVVVSSMGFLIF
jgi:hypothetical protein